MRFARVLFWGAGAWGILVVAPMYFLYGKLAQHFPPPPTHPELYYGFVGVTLAWQFAFFVIASDPLRFRPMMIPALLEKLVYVCATAVLYLEGRISPVQLMTAGPDALLGALLVIAIFKTRPSPLPKALKQIAMGGEA